MVPRIHSEEGLETIGALRGTPGSSRESFKIVAKHRVGMIEGKDRIEAACFKLALPNNAPPSAFRGRMLCVREKFRNKFRVMWALIGH